VKKYTVLLFSVLPAETGCSPRNDAHASIAILVGITFSSVAYTWYLHSALCIPWYAATLDSSLHDIILHTPTPFVIQIPFFWSMTPFSHVEVCRRFVQTLCLAYRLKNLYRNARGQIPDDSNIQKHFNFEQW